MKFIFDAIFNSNHIDKTRHCSTLNSPLLVYSLTSFRPQREKTCLRGFANNTGADQPAHPRSLISAFFIRFLKSIIYKLAIGEIATF